MERKTLKPKSSFRSHPRELSGSKFVLTCHHCTVIGHIRPQCSMLNREQNHIPKSLPKKPSGRDFVTIVVHLVILNLITLSFKFLKEKKNLSFLEVVFCKLNWIWLKVISCWSMWLILLPSCLCASLVLILPTFVSLLMRNSFQIIALFGWGRVPMVELMLFWSLI